MNNVTISTLLTFSFLKQLIVYFLLRLFQLFLFLYTKLIIQLTYFYEKEVFEEYKSTRFQLCHF